MKITVTTSSDLIFVLDVSADLELENFKVWLNLVVIQNALTSFDIFSSFQAFCEVESGIPSAHIGVAYNGQLLTDNKKALKDYGISDGDVVIIESMPQGSAAGGKLGDTDKVDCCCCC